MRCGLLGRHLSHSYSPLIHSMLGDYSYDLFEKEPESLTDFLKNENWDGINVTVPYKKAVLPFLDELSPIAESLGAVNTIIRRGSKLIGHNTDYFGFNSMIKAGGLELAGKKALILGSGGASATAAAVLRERGAQVIVISRTGENNYGNLHLHEDAALLVNATPVGMFPDNGNTPLDLDALPHLEGVLDLIYNPTRTKLLLDAKKRGLIAINGLLMLVAQAKEAAEWFTGSKIDDSRTEQIYNQLCRQMQNIVLIGMPGCGKSTIGRLLAEATGKRFADADTRIEELAGMPIPEIFEKHGEDTFRDFETKALAELGKQSGLIIATGGGCVTRERNDPLLRQNGTTICLERDISRLPTEGRPLSCSGKLEQMYRQRTPLYEAFADLHVGNNGTVAETVTKILEVLK